MLRIRELGDVVMVPRTRRCGRLLQGRWHCELVPLEQQTGSHTQQRHSLPNNYSDGSASLRPASQPNELTTNSFRWTRIQNGPICEG